MMNLLVPCDGSLHALEAVRFAAAQAAASPGHARVELVYAAPPDSTFTLSADRLGPDFPHAARDALQPGVDILEQSGIPSKVHCRPGDAAAAIAEQVAASGCTALVMGKRGGGRLASALFGSITSAVLHLVAVPVTLVSSGSGHVEVNKILVACDTSAAAQRALAYAVDLALAEPATELELLHVLDPMTLDAQARNLPRDELARLCPVQLAQAVGGVRNTLDAAGVRHSLLCRLGDPASEIIAQAHESGCGRVVMGSRGMSAAAKLMVGSVSARVVQYLRIPVTLIR